MTAGELQAIEPTLKETGSAKLTVVGTPTSNEYSVQSEAVATSDKYTITRKSNGEIERVCSPTGVGACPSSGSW